MARQNIALSLPECLKKKKKTTSRATSNEVLDRDRTGACSASFIEYFHNIIQHDGRPKSQVRPCLAIINI
jgi:hypothetical protein